MAAFPDFLEQTARGNRARWLITLGISAISLCIIRLMYLQLIRGRALEEASESNRTQVLVEHAPRGRILDRNGQVLADNQPVFVVLFSPFGLSPTDFQHVADRLAPLINTPPIELERRIFSAVRAKSMLRISDRLSRQQAFLIMQDRVHLPGISLAIEEQRFYPLGESASHILGYVGQITDDELSRYGEEGYHMGDWIGKSGLERLYDPLLHGQDGGFLIEVDALGRQVRIIRHVLPQAGHDLVLTIDERIEKMAEDRLRETGHPGAAVMLDPRSGELLALASSPGFDPNVFLPLGDSDQRRALLKDPNLPLYNRAIQALYPPGSTFKIVTSMAGLETHQIHPDETVDCTGSYTLGLDRRIFHCWKKNGHGMVDFHKAVAESCDVYFYHMGLRMGPDTIEQYAKSFGLGQHTGIDLPSEKKGLLPMAWKTSLGQHWQSGDTLNYAIGQGALQVTPLQMANLIATVAMDGVMWQPYLVKPSTGNRMVTHLQYASQSWFLLKNALVDVVKSGTGAASQISGTEVAGKTGTAQATKGKEHGWFVAYAPADDPRFACAVVVEHGGHGGSVAAPIVHDLLVLALGAKETATPPTSEGIQGD